MPQQVLIDLPQNTPEFLQGHNLLPFFRGIFTQTFFLK